MNRMLLKLMAGPVFLLGISFFLLEASDGLLQKARLINTNMAPVFQMLSNSVFYVALAVFAWFVLFTLYRGYQIWQWQSGREECCSTCCGMLLQHSGRYGLYMKCLNCGRGYSC